VVDLVIEEDLEEVVVDLEIEEVGDVEVWSYTMVWTDNIINFNQSGIYI
jgi:hypothetical protein